MFTNMFSVSILLEVRMVEDPRTADGDDQVAAGHRNFQDSVRINHHTLTTL